MPTEAILASGLTKTYGPITAVDHVDLRVPAGGIFGLLGPNGAGKTTIIKLLTGLSDLTAGEAIVAGYDVKRSPMEVKQRIGWVAAEVILDDEFSAWENLWLQAKLQRLTDWQGRAEQSSCTSPCSIAARTRSGRSRPGCARSSRSRSRSSINPR